MYTYIYIHILGQKTCQKRHMKRFFVFLASKESDVVQSQCIWSLFNGTWQKRRGELDN